MSPPVFELTVLRRVAEGGITVADGGYVHHGAALVGKPAEALVRLHTAGHLAIGALGPGGHRPVLLTAAGTARLTELTERGGHG